MPESVVTLISAVAVVRTGVAGLIFAVVTRLILLSLPQVLSEHTNRTAGNSYAPESPDFKPYCLSDNSIISYQFLGLHFIKVPDISQPFLSGIFFEIFLLVLDGVGFSSLFIIS